MGKPHTSVIELNGKVYDLKAGHSSTHHTSLPQNPKPSTNTMPKPTPTPIPISDGSAIDGVAKPRSHAPHSPAPAAAKKVQRSKTLMRSAVHKPTHQKHQPTHAITKSTIIDVGRVARSAHIPKSHLISRFGPRHVSSIAPQLTPLSVQPEPDAIPRAPVLDDHFEKAVLSIPKGHTVSHANPFENALATAISHTQVQPKKASRTNRTARHMRVSPKVVRAAAVLILLLGIGGFFVHHNIPNLAMGIAAKRAGVAARLPGYQAAGFSLNGAIGYSPGQIQVSYRSNSDDRSYTVTQKSTNLSNASLQPTEVLGLNTSYQTVERGGKTIYISDQNKATWVDNGILYEVDGSGLNSDQLLRVVSSF